MPNGTCEESVNHPPGVQKSVERLSLASSETISTHRMKNEEPSTPSSQITLLKATGFSKKTILKGGAVLNTDAFSDSVEKISSSCLESNKPEGFKPEENGATFSQLSKLVTLNENTHQSQTLKHSQRLNFSHTSRSPENRKTSSSSGSNKHTPSPTNCHSHSNSSPTFHKPRSKSPQFGSPSKSRKYSSRRSRSPYLRSYARSRHSRSPRRSRRSRSLRRSRHLRSPHRSRHSKSPHRSRRSRSPHRSRHSRSPHRSRHSRSPHRSRHSRSPHRSRHSRSPHRSRDSRSPRRSRHSRSPHRSRHSRSPRRSRHSRSPRRSRHSPRRSRHSRSPQRSRQLKSPGKSKRSQSPYRRLRSSSNLKRSKSPRRSKHSRSPYETDRKHSASLSKDSDLTDVNQSMHSLKSLEKSRLNGITMTVDVNESKSSVDTAAALSLLPSPSKDANNGQPSCDVCAASLLCDKHPSYNHGDSIHYYKSDHTYTYHKQTSHMKRKRPKSPYKDDMKKPLLATSSDEEYSWVEVTKHSQNDANGKGKCIH